MHTVARTWSLAVIGCLGVCGRAGGGQGDLGVVAAVPAPRSIGAPPAAPISVTFDRAVNPATITPQSFWAFGRWSGAATGTLALSAGNTIATLTPTQPFSAGEQVMVVLSHDILGADGSSLRAAGCSWQFFTRARQASLAFTQTQDFSVRTTPSQTARAYGGMGCDLNGDRWLDLSIINEISADLRVFLNTADGSGDFGRLLQPPALLNDVASPSEPSDFNRDGHTDIAVANVAANTISILLGNGDGTFDPQQEVTVGGSPYGVAVVDADGDGDIDIVNTNYSAGNVSMLINDGAGAFSGPVYFPGGVGGERGLAVADMNNDFILDLVVGGWSSDQVAILLGDGKGFTFASVQASGGETRIVVCGDVNGDGHDDVAASNGQNNNAAILLGDGRGTLASPAIYPTTPFTGPSDLGDFDGDGDLDWLICSFVGTWQLMLNNGAGVFALDQEFTPDVAASCSVPMDIDNDGDLDLALIDEIADMVFIMNNSGTTRRADLTGDGTVNIDDLLALIAAWGNCPPLPAPCQADINGSGVVNIDDLLALISNWG